MNETIGSKSVKLLIGAEMGRVAAYDCLESAETTDCPTNNFEGFQTNTKCDVPTLGIRRSASCAQCVSKPGTMTFVELDPDAYPELPAQSMGLSHVMRRPKRVVTRKPVMLLRHGRPLLIAYVANTWLGRLKGLFAYPPLSATQALILSPCSSVHTVGMKYTIDVAFLSRRGLVLKIVTLAPQSGSRCRYAHYAVEMVSGTAGRLGIQVGQMLEVGE